MKKSIRTHLNLFFLAMILAGCGLESETRVPTDLRDVPSGSIIDLCVHAIIGLPYGTEGSMRISSEEGMPSPWRDIEGSRRVTDGAVIASLPKGGKECGPLSGITIVFEEGNEAMTVNYKCDNYDCKVLLK